MATLEVEIPATKRGRKIFHRHPDGWRIPRTWRVTVTDEELQAHVVLEATGGPGGAYCTRVREVSALDGGRVTSSMVNKLRIQQYVNHSLEMVATRDTDPELASPVAATLEAQGKKRRRTPLTPTELKRIAQIYRDNADHNPSLAVATELGINRNTARYRVTRAREEGYLEPVQ